MAEIVRYALESRVSCAPEVVTGGRAVSVMRNWNVPALVMATMAMRAELSTHLSN